MIALLYRAMRFPDWIKELLDRLLRGKMSATDQPWVIAEYQIGVKTNGSMRRVAITLEDASGIRISDTFDPASATELMVYATVLRLARSRFFIVSSKSIMTTRFDGSTEPSDLTTLSGKKAIREFDVRWDRASGGWILLRFTDYRRFVLKFSLNQGLEFVSTIAALEKAPAFLVPAMSGIYGDVPEAPWLEWAMTPAGLTVQ